MPTQIPKPTRAFIGASWGALAIGTGTYFVGLFNATIGLGEKGYYIILMLYALFSVVSLQKTIRDREQGIPVTDAYYMIAWAAVISALSLMVIGLYNATFTLSEKGFYGLAYTLSLFAVITVQKNTRDMGIVNGQEDGISTKGTKSWFKSDSSAWGTSEAGETTTDSKTDKP